MIYDPNKVGEIGHISAGWPKQILVYSEGVPFWGGLENSGDRPPDENMCSSTILERSP